MIIILVVIVILALATIITIARLRRDLRRGGSLFHWSPPRWEHDETASSAARSDAEDLRLPPIEKPQNDDA